MELNTKQIKLSIWRTSLRLMPLILMGTITLFTFWLVKKNTPVEKSAIERVRLHEPDYIITNGALSALDKDRAFLLEGGVFTNDQIDAYIALKTQEVDRYEQIPHPVEFEMYYNS